MYDSLIILPDSLSVFELIFPIRILSAWNSEVSSRGNIQVFSHKRCSKRWYLNSGGFTVLVRIKERKRQATFVSTFFFWGGVGEGVVYSQCMIAWVNYRQLALSGVFLISNRCVLCQNVTHTFSFKMTYRVSVWYPLPLLQGIPIGVLYYNYFFKNALP